MVYLVIHSQISRLPPIDQLDPLSIAMSIRQLIAASWQVDEGVLVPVRQQHIGPGRQKHLPEDSCGWMCRALASDNVLGTSTCPVLISIDTFYASVAAEAVHAGAHIVNDVSGGTLDAAMYSQVLAATSSPCPAGSVVVVNVLS